MTLFLDPEKIGERIKAGVPIVEFDHVSISFDANDVLKSVSFAVARGETRIILGPAGVGKSVLMKLANGLMMPDSGEVRILGQNLSEISQNEMFAMRRMSAWCSRRARCSIR